MTGFKHRLKSFIYQCSWARQICGAVYCLTGRRPWSFGYLFHKFVYIRNVVENQSDSFRQGKLPDAYGAGMDERVVEYPWFFSQLSGSEQRILDAGSSLNHYLILTAPQLKGRNLYLMTLAEEGEYRLKNQPVYIYGDLRKTGFTEDFFDVVVSISTIEHVGMDNTFLYTDDQMKKEDVRLGFLDAVREFKRILKPGGSLYITAPFGRYQHHGWFQIFDGEMVDHLIREFCPQSVEETYFKYENHQWNFSTKAVCAPSIYFDIHKQKKIPGKEDLAASESVVCLVLKK